MCLNESPVALTALVIRRLFAKPTALVLLRYTLAELMEGGGGVVIQWNLTQPVGPLTEPGETLWGDDVPPPSHH